MSHYTDANLSYLDSMATREEPEDEEPETEPDWDAIRNNIEDRDRYDN